jgi:tape measure domain-containing protein
MANLGTLNFSVQIKDETEKQLEKIRKDILKKLEVTIKPTIKVDVASQVKNQIKEPFNIRLQVEKDSLERVRKQAQAVIDGATPSGGRKFTASDLRATRANVLIEEHEQRLASLREQTRQKTANANAAEERLNAARARTALVNERLKVTQQQLNRMLDDSIKKGTTLQGFFMKLGGTVALGMLARQIVKVTGEFEFMEQAIKSLVGSEREGVELMGKLREFARISPLEVRDVTKAAQTLLGFNVELAKVPDMIQRIGDVSMGNKDRFNALTLAFAQTTSAARLTGEDLRQYVNAGFNPLQVIAEKTGRSMRDLKDEMSKGAISVEMVEQAFIDATSAGGKFYKMSERQSQTINGQLAKLKDSLDRAFDSIGRNNKGVIMGAISSASALVENYEKIIHILEGLVATYGLYRTAVFLATEAEKGYTIAQTLSMQATILMEKAQKALNATILANPYVLAAVALGGLVTVLLATVDTTNEAEIANERYNETLRKNGEEVEKEKKHIDDLLGTLSDETEAQGKRTAAYNELVSKYPEIFSKYKTEKDLIDNLTEARQRENAEIEKKTRLLAKQQYDDASTRKKELNRLKWLQDNINISTHGKQPTAEQAEYLRLYRKYEKEIKETQTWYGSVESAISKLSGVADKEYNLNLGERRKQQITDFTNAIKNLTPEQAKAQAKRYNDLIRKAKENGKKWIGFGDDYVPISIDDAKSVAKQLEEQATKETHTLKEWAEQTAKNTDEARKAAKGVFDNTKQYTKEQAQKVIKDANAALAASQKERDSFRISDKEGDKANKQLDNERKQAEREAKLTEEALEKIAGIRTRAQIKAANAAKDLEFSTREAEITFIEDETERAIKQIELNKDRKLEAISREYEELRQRRIEEAKKLWDADTKNKGVNFYMSEEYKTAASDSQYTEAQKANREAREREAKEIAKRAINERLRMEMQSLYDYLKAYGTIEQKKYAITKEYDAKIAKEHDANRKKLIEAEKRSQLAQLDARYLADNIDWRQTFGGVGNVLQSLAKETLEKVNDYMKTPDFKNLDSTNKNAYRELRRQLIESGGISASNPFSKAVWDDISTAAQNYRQSVKELSNANERAKEIRERLTKAEDEAAKDPNNPLKQKAVNDLKEQFGEVNGVVLEAQEKTAETQEDLREKTEQVAKGFQNFDTILNQITSGTLSGFVLAIGNLVKKIAGNEGDLATNIGELFGEAGKNIGGIVGAILQVIDILGTEPTKFIDELLDKVAAVIETVLSQLPQIIGSVIGGVGNIVGGLFKGIGNLLTGGTAFGSNVDEMESEIAELAKSNEVLAQSIDTLAKSISNNDSTNSESEEAYRRALKAEKEWEQNQRKAIDDRASEWSNGGHGFLGLGGKHSFNAYLNEGFSGWADFNKVLKQFGYDTRVKSAGDIWNLTPEQMQLLRDYAPKAWADLLNTDGESNPSELLDEYIERAGKIDELTSALNEKLTGYSWDAFKGSYTDTLKDLTSTTEDFADNIEELLTQAILNSLVNEAYKDRIQNLYKMIADAASDESEGGSMMTSSELAEIRAANEALSNDLLQARKNLLDAGILRESSGKDSSSMASSIKGVTEQTAELLGSYMNGIRADVSVDHALLSVHLPAIENLITRQTVLSEVQVSHLANIAEYTRRTADNTEAIGTLAANQGRIYEILHRIETGTTKVKMA